MLRSRKGAKRGRVMSEEPKPRRFQICGDFIMTIILGAIVYAVIAAFIASGKLPHFFG
jgi:hypothetical protein